MPKMRLSGFIEAFEEITNALEAARLEAAPIYRKMVEEWATETTKKAIANLNRPQWLLSKSMEPVVKPYKSVIWALAGVKHESKNWREPGYYVIFHESGWRPNPYWAPSAPKGFLKKAKAETAPILRAKAEEANKNIAQIITERARERHWRKRNQLE